VGSFTGIGGQTIVKSAGIIAPLSVSGPAAGVCPRAKIAPELATVSATGLTDTTNRISIVNRSRRWESVMSTNKIIAELDAEQMTREVPEFAPGDTVVVQVRVKEGTRERLQAFEGVCIGKRNRGLNSAFTVRKISHGVGVERTFQTYSPLVDSITVKRRGDVRQAKLYYLRELSGKAARIKEKLSS